jgi:hypothetical protein
MSASDWGITRRVLVHVALADGALVEGEMHLLARITYPPGPETPLEMLNRREPFFAVTLAGQGVALVSKAQVVAVSCREEVPSLDPDRASAAQAAELLVELYDGAEYRGRATYELPPSNARVLDYINGPGPFFSLWDDDVIRYVNKSFVRLIRPLD